VKLVCFIDIAYVIGLMLVLNALGKLQLGSSGDLKIHLLQALGVLGGVGALIAIVAAIKSLTDSQQWVWYKIWNALLAVGCVAFIWFLAHWHLLNFNLRF
jgi:hypothetical protein